MRIVKAKPNQPGQVLREHRERQGLSCEDFAKELGIAEVTLRSLENGTRNITAERAVEIEEKTAGAIGRHQLRPDLYPEEARAA